MRCGFVQARLARALRRRFNGQVEFNILGPLEIVEGGRAVRLESPKQRALLTLLLLQEGEVVSRDRLIEELWLGNPPPAAETTLRSHLSRLRSVVGASRLETRPPGYALALAPDELDAATFRRLGAEGRQALELGRMGEAADLLRRALGLWRGPALADFAYESFAQSAIARLEESRLVVTEERITADLALGRHADLVGELEALVAAHPLRESLRAQFMLALYRSNRQAEALETYQQARLILTERLGLEPSESLKNLQRLVLDHDPSLIQTAGHIAEHAEALADRAVAPFVGRKREMAELLLGMDEARADCGSLFLISGEPGIGKSRLTEELLRRAREARFRVLVGRCWEAGGAPAYWPWVQGMRGYVLGCDLDTLRNELGRGAEDIAQVLPELRDCFPSLAQPSSNDPEGARFRLFDSIAGFLREVSLAQPLLFVLEDLHAADAPSLLLLRFLADAVANSRLLVVGTYRDVDPVLNDALSAALSELGRQPATRFLPLTGLPEREVRTYIELATEIQPSAGVVNRIHEQTEGNPLFVGEIVRLLEIEGSLEEIADAPGGHLTIPEGVRAVIRKRLRHLSEDCKLVLVLAAVLGREFDLEALEQVSQVSGDHLLDTLDEAARERVVAAVPGQPGRMRFAHALIREAVYDDLPPGRRLQLHRRVGEALEALHATNPEPHLAELAFHFFQSARPSSYEKALEYAGRAADRSMRLLAYEEAARLYGMALRVLTGTERSDQDRRCELLLRLGEAQARGGESPRARSTFLEAADIARSAGWADRLGRAALGYGGRFVWARAGTDPHLISLLEESLRLLAQSDGRLRAKLLARLAGALRDQPSRELRTSLSKTAVETARRIGDPEALAYALDGNLAVVFWPKAPSVRLEVAKELLHLAEAGGDRERALQAQDYQLTALLQLGDISAFDTVLGEMGKLADELRQPAQLWTLLHARAMRALSDGRFAEAECLAQEALTAGQRTLAPDAAFVFRMQTFVLHKELGQLQTVESDARRFVEEYPARSLCRCVLANLLSGLGRNEEARAIFEELAANGFDALPVDDEWLLSTTLLSEVCTLLADVPRAATLHDLLLPHGRMVASLWNEVSLGSVSRYLGCLCSTLSR
ncbi:MAG: eukaryotic-like serine/threonine-protein kinase, partial [Gaiellales bacterium]|nr:eukaryotic-like serine/threonine-protein kinase [Gaiellales bacterium]